MKQENGMEDETMNLFKLKLYNWNVNDAIKYYKNDKFCNHYCINKNHKYGCNKSQNFLFGCSYEHSISLDDLSDSKLQTQRDYKQCEL